MTTTITDYIAHYGQIVVREDDKGFLFFSDGKSRIGGKFKVSELRSRGIL